MIIWLTRFPFPLKLYTKKQLKQKHKPNNHYECGILMYTHRSSRTTDRSRSRRRHSRYRRTRRFHENAFLLRNLYSLSVYRHWIGNECILGSHPIRLHYNSFSSGLECKLIDQFMCFTHREQFRFSVGVLNAPPDVIANGVFGEGIGALDVDLETKCCRGILACRGAEKLPSGIVSDCSVFGGSECYGIEDG